MDHELGHTVVSERMGHEVSPTLWAVAHDYAPGTAPYEERLFEEAIVLSLQRYLRTGEVGRALTHPDVRPHYQTWTRELLRLSAQIPTPGRALEEAAA